MRVIATDFPRTILPMMERLGGRASSRATAFRGALAVVSDARVLAVCSLVDCQPTHNGEFWWRLEAWQLLPDPVECAAYQPRDGFETESGWEPMCLNSFACREVEKALEVQLAPAPRVEEKSVPICGATDISEAPQLSLFGE